MTNITATCTLVTTTTCTTHKAVDPTAQVITRVKETITTTVVETTGPTHHMLPTSRVTHQATPPPEVITTTTHILHIPLMKDITPVPTSAALVTSGLVTSPTHRITPTETLTRTTLNTIPVATVKLVTKPTRTSTNMEPTVERATTVITRTKVQPTKVQMRAIRVPFITTCVTCTKPAILTDITTHHTITSTQA